MDEKLLGILEKVVDPHLGENIVSLGYVRELDLQAGRVKLVLPYAAKSWHDTLRQEVISLLQEQKPSVLNVEIITRVNQHVAKQGVTKHPGVKNIIAVASGKGGVGKSTIALNMALALQSEGATVGLVDADIHGPSQQHLLGLAQRVTTDGSISCDPVMAHDLQTMSIGFFIEENQPVIWRGPMVTKALQQLVMHTKWQQLDYLIVDLPPGTGDIHLSMVQKMPINGAVICTTPQELSVLDANRACEMFKKVRLPILGIVENMSFFECPCCSTRTNIFGEGGAEKIAKSNNVSLLGKIPLAAAVTQMSDQGEPAINAEGFRQYYQQVAIKTAAKLSKSNVDQKSMFPTIVMQDS